MSNLSITTNQVSDVFKYSTHPGVILKKEFLEPYNISQYRLAKSLNISERFISKLVNGKRGITADLSVRLSKFFGTSPSFFANLQQNYDIRKAQNELLDQYQLNAF